MLKGERAVLLMKQLKPLMGIRRKNQIDNAIKNYKKQRKILTHQDRLSIVSDYQSGISAVNVALKYNITREHVHRLNRKYGKVALEASLIVTQTEGFDSPPYPNESS